MLSFLFGLTAGAFVILNGPSVRRGIALAVLKGGDAAAEAGRYAQRASAQLVEDFEDAFAEARAERARAEAHANGLSELQNQLRQIHAEIVSLESQINSDRAR